MSSPATTAPRPDGRAVDELRPITITRGWSRQAE
ncbi:ribonuclease PH, partial [Xanthomonas citri pv. citri]|nr:ribonuclease PH [Xanthomonas citri pv. citri]